MHVLSHSQPAKQSLVQFSPERKEMEMVQLVKIQDGDSEAPIVSPYNDRIRPILDAVDKLRNLNVVDEGIELLTIVVVGDQSSGKSSVLESLAGISLPRGQGICTRVPLVMRLQNHSSPDPDLVLEFNGKLVHTDEANISDAINLATDEIAGTGKGISNTPLTLVVKKKGVPDLTMVDLPGITRVLVHGQPENIYDQIREMIMKYIKPEASIILNVLSATVDFPTCESIRMSQSVDKTGERTLAVVTKCDKSPEGLLEKVTSDDVNIGLGYVCVRNRIGDESYEEARKEEASLFASHPLLSKIDKSIVGVPVLAQKLVQIQASCIAWNLPEIVKKINDKLNLKLSELSKLPKSMSNVAEAMTAFVRIVGNVKESLRKILLRGEFDEYPDEKKMHCTARLVEMLNRYSDELQNCPESDPLRDFMMAEIQNLEEAKKISLPNFLPHSAFLAVLQGKVNGVKGIPLAFVEELWDYIREVMTEVLARHVGDYHHLKLSAWHASHNLVAKMKESSLRWTKEVVEMERVTDYTSDPAYLAECDKLMSQKTAFIAKVLRSSSPHVGLEGLGEIDVQGRREHPSLVNPPYPAECDMPMSRRPAFIENVLRYPSCSHVYLEGLGEIDVRGLREHPSLVNQAYDLKMMVTAYWKIVLRRLVDGMALHVQHSLHRLMGELLEAEIMTACGGGGIGIERMMEESPSVAAKRAKLNGSVMKLKDCKTVLAGIIMDSAASSYAH